MTFTLMPRPARELAPAARRFGLAIGAVLAGFVVVTVALAGSHGPAIGAYSTRGTYSYVTEPSLHPPKIRVEKQTPAGGLAPGYILTANFFDLNEPPIIGQSGPLILDNKLQPVWFEPVPERVAAANLSLQTYEGKPALAWWQGVVTNTGATESGEDVVVNQHYQPVARLKGADGWVLTLHALAIDGDDAWVTANKNIPLDLSRYGGAYNGALIDSAVQEYNIKTGRLLRTWDALEHIPLGDSYATLPTNGFPWDAYHVNALELIGNGAFLVSMRNTWGAYAVNVDTGKIEWTLGGKHSSYKFGPGAAFQWQHDVALGPSSTVTMFDDHCCQLTGGGTSVKATGPSRGLVLKLDRVRVPRRWWPSTAPRAASNRNTWATRSRCPAARRSWDGDRNRTSPSTAAPAGCCWKASSLAPTSAIGQRSSNGSACRFHRRLPWPVVAVAGPRSTRAGTAPRRSSPGACWAERARVAWSSSPPPSGPALRRRSRWRRATRASRSRRWTPPAR